jgi:hypothetical protein
MAAASRSRGLPADEGRIGINNGRQQGFASQRAALTTP